MSERNWRAVAAHYVSFVREEKCNAETAINELEMELLNEEAVEKLDRSIQLGRIELGMWRNAFSWLSDLARYRYVRFTGISWGRHYLGFLVGSPTPPIEAERQARVQELYEQSDATFRVKP